MIFNDFPKVSYKLSNGFEYRISDITRYSNIDYSKLDNFSYYRFYDIVDGERPDVVSTKLYRVPNYFWTFFLINDHLKNGYGSWPMSYQELETHINNEYEGISIQTSESFLEYGFVKIGQTFTIESDNEATAKVYAINQDLNQIILKNVTKNSKWLLSENLSLVPINYDTSTPRLSIQKAVPYRYGLSHYEDQNGIRIPITYGVNYNFSGDTNGTIYQTNQRLFEVNFDEVEKRINTERSKIRVIRQEDIFDFSEQFRDTINAS
jgi:hypothetical protein